MEGVDKGSWLGKLRATLNKYCLGISFTEGPLGVLFREPVIVSDKLQNDCMTARIPAPKEVWKVLKSPEIRKIMKHNGVVLSRQDAWLGGATKSSRQPSAKQKQVWDGWKSIFVDENDKLPRYLYPQVGCRRVVRPVWNEEEKYFVVPSMRVLGNRGNYVGAVGAFSLDRGGRNFIVRPTGSGSCNSSSAEAILIILNSVPTDSDLTIVPSVAFFVRYSDATATSLPIS